MNEKVKFWYKGKLIKDLNNNHLIDGKGRSRGCLLHCIFWLGGIWIHSQVYGSDIQSSGGRWCSYYNVMERETQMAAFCRTHKSID